MRKSYQLLYREIHDKEWTLGIIVKVGSLQEAKKMARDSYGDPSDAEPIQDGPVQPQVGAGPAISREVKPEPRQAAEPAPFRKRVYLAGALNAPACGYLKNVGTMMKWAEELRLQGFAVFNPAQELLAGICSKNGMTYPEYFDNGAAWLAAAEAVFLCPGWQESEGVKKELQIAAAHNIPRFEKIEDLKKWREGCRK